LHLKKPDENKAPLEMLRWYFAETFGWSLEYIDNLNFEDVQEFLQISEGKSKAMPKMTPPGKRGKYAT